VSSPSTTSAIWISMDQREQGRDAEPSPPSPCISSFMCRPTTLDCFCGRCVPNMAELREWLITIGAKVVSHGRYVTLQMAEVAVSRRVFADVLSMISLCGHRKDRATARVNMGYPSLQCWGPRKQPQTLPV
jgi:hypothetical protein